MKDYDMGWARNTEAKRNAKFLWGNPEREKSLPPSSESEDESKLAGNNRVIILAC
jgi:hypothetical protein